MIGIAQAYWHNGVEARWIAEEFQTLAGRVTDLCELLSDLADVGGRFAKDDPSAPARADRLAVRFFDAVEDIHCGNWAKEGWR